MPQLSVGFWSAFGRRTVGIARRGQSHSIVHRGRVEFQVNTAFTGDPVGTRRATVGGVDDITEPTPAAHLADVRTELARVRDQVRALRERVRSAEERAAERLESVHPAHREGTRNLIHYLELRSSDLRPLQQRLSALGLSSLGRMEPGVLRNLDAVLEVLDLAIGPSSTEGVAGSQAEETLETPSESSESASPTAPTSPMTASLTPTALRMQAAQLFGGSPEDRSTRIMVTLPSEAANDAHLVQGCVDAGMDLARINSAHDDARAWATMAGHVREAAPHMPIAVDLGGPKVRTGPMPVGPHVVKVRPERDDAGGVTAPAYCWLVAPDAGLPEVAVAAPAAPTIPVEDADWIAARAPGETVRFTDARGKRRRFRVVQCDGAAVLVAGDRTAYLQEGAHLKAHGSFTTVGLLPEVPGKLIIRTGDTIVLSAALTPARSEGDIHHLGCTLPEALEAVRVGDRVSFDDGQIDGMVREIIDSPAEEDGADGADGVDSAMLAGGGRQARIEVTLAANGGSKLRAEKGINFPDTDLPVSALTAEDLGALDTVIHFADIIQLSFVRSASDVRRLHEELDARGAGHLGIVVKIETTQGFQALPEILLELMRRERVGVMIARGDLAVEARFERLAELQEEILWLCEAAHVPVIWATQVLDGMASSGVPTRAEVTDAAVGQRAECVMLNKGPHITEAIEALDDILRRMQGHHDKKRSLLRQLHSWSRE